MAIRNFYDWGAEVNEVRTLWGKLFPIEASPPPLTCDSYSAARIDLDAILRGLAAIEARTVPPALHSEDFRSVHWFGTDYCFTATQAACVGVLWRAWENKTPEVSQELVLAGADSESGRLSDVFGGSEAWKTMIVQGTTKGDFSTSRA